MTERRKSASGLGPASSPLSPRGGTLAGGEVAAERRVVYFDRDSASGIALDDEVVASALVEAAPDGMMMVDEQGQILLVNRQVEELFGYGRHELVGQAVEMLLPEALRRAHQGHRTRFRVEPRTRAMGAGLRLLGQRADGAKFPVEISLSPLRTDAGGRVIAAVRDISARIEVEAESAEVRRVLDATIARDLTARLEMERRARDAECDVALLEDRQRIARDLHDRVIQRLFAAGLGIEAIRGRAGDDPLLSERLARVVGELDDTIRELRSSIFELTFTSSGQSLRATVFDVCADQRAALGFDPVVRFNGLVDTVDDGLGGHLVAVLRESLSNVARHARASAVQVTVAVGPDLVLQVQDNGIGLAADAPHQGGSGLGNMSVRAEKFGGTCDLTSASPSGATLDWRVPLA
jgi:two-component system, NarL family, sensor histidine kinase DevS